MRYLSSTSGFLFFSFIESDLRSSLSSVTPNPAGVHAVTRVTNRILFSALSSTSILGSVFFFFFPLG